ncbi:MAG: cation diffusion facilitator family transporter [Bauldia sp.]
MSIGHDHAHRHDDHEHGHVHGAHGDAHVHAPASFGFAFAVGIGLNAAFVLTEGVFGVLGNSVALLADAGHNLSDVLGLAVAWVAAYLATRAPTQRYTYGLRGSSILAALFNAACLLVAVGAIGWEAILRLAHPEPVAGPIVIAVAAVGIAVNGITAWLFMAGRKQDLNIRAAFLHLAADAAVSAGVVVAGIVIVFTGWVWLDPAVSLVLVAVIIWGTWGLLRDSVAMALDAVPPEIDPTAVRAALLALPGVASLHDLHIWPMSTTEISLTAHLVMPGGHPDDAFLMRACGELQDHFGIGHATLQVETNPETHCMLEPDSVV